MLVFCLIYCWVPCLAPLPIVKGVLSLLRKVRNEDDNLLLQRESRRSVVEESMRREYLAFTGAWGLLMFVIGAFNPVSQVLLMVELCQNCEFLLFTIVLSSSLSTVVTSLPLAFGILQEIAREMKRDFFTEVMERGHIKWIILLSTSRIESLSVLRLRLCNFVPKPFPMKPKHFYFIQSIGAYHFFVKDIPHVLVSLARLAQNRNETSACPDWVAHGLCLFGQGVLHISPWFAIFFGSVNLVVMLLDLSIRAMAWTALRNNPRHHSSSSLWVQSGLSHRAAELLLSRRDIPQSAIREPLHTIGEEELDDDSEEEEPASVDLLAGASSAVKNYVLQLQAELARARQQSNLGDGCLGAE